jgi:hypothetical protein
MAFPYCNDLVAVAFVKQHERICADLAAAVHVPVEFILAVPCSETAYGETGSFRKYNNFFSMHAAGPDRLPKYATGVVISAATRDLKNPTYVATYASFDMCGMSFIDKYGKAIVGIGTPEAFALALVAAHFNPGDASEGGDAYFVPKLIDVIAAVKARLQCPA